MPGNQTYRLSEEIRGYIINEKLKNSRPKLIKETIEAKFHRSISYSTIRNTWARYLRKELEDPEPLPLEKKEIWSGTFSVKQGSQSKLQ